MRAVRIGIVVAVLVVAAPRPSYAFLGFGDIVFDPGVYAQMVSMVTQTLRQVQIAMDTYRVANQQFETVKTMSTELPRMGRYATRPWGIGDAGGGVWIAGRRAIPRVEHGAMQPGLARDIERLRRWDVVARRSVDRFGHSRNAADFVAQLLDELDGDVRRPNRTLTGVADTISAHGVIQARQQEAADQLAAARMELELEAAARERDADADHLAMAGYTQSYFLRNSKGD